MVTVQLFLTKRKIKAQNADSGVIILLSGDVIREVVDKKDVESVFVQLMALNLVLSKNILIAAISAKGNLTVAALYFDF